MNPEQAPKPQAQPVAEAPGVDAKTRARRRRAKGRRESIAAFVLACRIVCGLAMVLAGLAIWFWIAGLPARATRFILKQLESPGLVISAERVWLDPLEGIKVRELRVTPEAKARGAAGPLSAREVLVNMSWMNLLCGGPALEGLTVRGGGAMLRLPPEFGTNGLPCDIALSNVTARLVNTWDMFRLEEFSARWPGGTLEAQGVTVMDLSPKAEAAQAELMGPHRPASPLDASQRLQASLERSPGWARELYRHLATVETRAPVKIAITFRHHANAAELLDLRLRIEGGAAMSHGVRVDGFHAEAGYAGGLLSLPEIELRAEGRSCRLDGRFVVTNQLMELHAVNELPPSYWRSLLPQEWLASLAHTPLLFHGALRSEIWLPPAALTNTGRRWRATLAWDDAEYRDLRLARGRADVSRDGDTFTVTNFHASLAREGMHGPLDAHLLLDLRTLDAVGRLKTTAHPMLFGPWIPPATRTFIRLFEFPADLPTVDWTFHAGGRSNPLFVIHGPLRASNFTYRGVALESLDTVISQSNGVLALAPFFIARTNGTVNGRLDLDLPRKIYAFDLRSTTDPLAIGQMISTQLLRAISVGHYNGPAKIHGHGAFAEDNPAGTDITVDVDADRIGLRWFEADHATFTLRNRGRQYETTNIVATAFGGEARARFFVYPSPGGGGDRYELDLETRSNDLRRLALAIQPGLKDPTPGVMKLRLQIAGALSDTNFSTVKGEGSVKISDGELHKIRLLGGLSTLLSKLWPDLGYAKQSGLAMTFDIRDGKLTTSDLVLDGSLMSVKANGTYVLNSGGLDFLAEVQLLKKGTVVGEAIRFITTPVTKLLRVQLNGTLAEPEWKNATLDKIF